MMRYSKVNQRITFVCGRVVKYFLIVACGFPAGFSLVLSKCEAKPGRILSDFETYRVFETQQVSDKLKCAPL